MYNITARVAWCLLNDLLFVYGNVDATAAGARHQRLAALTKHIHCSAMLPIINLLISICFQNFDSYVGILADGFRDQNRNTMLSSSEKNNGPQIFF